VKQPVVPEFKDEYDFLSNFYRCDITVPVGEHKLHFLTAEHLFQAAKNEAMTSGTENRKSYVLTLTNDADPNRAKRLGKSVKIDLDKWESIKVDCMRTTVKTKFDQNPSLQKRLLDTGPALLVEGNTWGDEYWGRCKGKGYNLLGSILMEVRGYYYWKDAK
jgi:hypothetical protein